MIMKNFFKKNKENLIIFCIFLIIFILLSVFCYEIYLRFFFSLIFLCKSIGYYFCRIFLIESSTPYDPYQYTLDHFQQGVTTLLPTNSNVFLAEIKASFFIIFNKTYFLNSFSSITFIFTYFNLIMTLIIIFVCIIVISRQLLLIQRNPKLIGDSNFLRKYKNFKAKKIDKVTDKLNLIKFKIKKFKILFLIISLLFSNVGAVIIDAISYLLISLANILLLPINLYHFIFSSYTALYSQLYFIPTFIRILVILFVFYKLRINHAKNKIYSLQDKNEDFAVNNLGIATLTTGVMGAGKDSFNAAVSLTMQRVFKRQWLEVMLKYKMLFRNFDFISYERYIKKAEENRYFSSSVQIKFMFEKYKNLLSQKKNEEATKLLEEYNFPKEFLNYVNSELFNGLEPLTIIDMLRDYGQCYFLYSSIRPNIYSNIAMRIPYRYLNEEYFPIFDFDIYNDKDVITYKESTHYCRIWNFDWRRLGNRFFANSGVSDCGIYNFSEGGKERGNMFTNSGKDKLDYEPNQKNDEFNKFVKLIRHLYTIDNTPYVKLLVNDQRIGSINADLSELFETTVSLKKEKKVKNSIFLYSMFDKVILNAI